MTKLNWVMVAGGFHEAAIGDGMFDRYAVNRIEGTWYLTYPGESHPDDFFGRLIDAKSAALNHYNQLV